MCTMCRPVRTALLAALAALLTLTVGALPAPASAAASSDGIVHVYGRANSTVRPDTCGYPLSYRVTVDKSRIADRYDAQDVDWTAEVTITGPGGFRSEFGFLWDDTSWQREFVCESPTRPGTYTVTAYITADGWTYDYSLDGYDDYSASLYTRTVRQTVRLYNWSSVTQARKKQWAHQWRTTGTVRVAGNPRANQVATLQRKKGTGWVTVATRRTNTRGQAVVIRKGHWGVFRWYYPGTSTAKPAASGTFRLPRR